MLARPIVSHCIGCEKKSGLDLFLRVPRKPSGIKEVCGLAEDDAIFLDF
jgi:hypothetical protein